MPGVHFQLKYMHQPQDLYGESEVMFGYVHNKTTTPPCMAYKECRNESRPCARECCPQTTEMNHNNNNPKKPTFL